MVVYSFFIFDRHAECIYKRQWLPRIGSKESLPSPSDSTPLTNGNAKDGTRTKLSTGTDDRLVFGAVYSLRNMVRKLGGDDDTFVCYRTSQYKLHYYETPTNLKFVMLTDTKSNNMRLALHQIYVNLYVEYVVKNPLSPVEHPNGIGVYNELFEQSLEQFVGVIINLSVWLCVSFDPHRDHQSFRLPTKVLRKPEAQLIIRRLGILGLSRYLRGMM